MSNSPNVLRMKALTAGLSTRHREIMRRIAMGESNRQIAHDLEMTEGRVSIIVNSPLFKSELLKMQEVLDGQVYNAMHELRKLQCHAVEALEDSVRQKELPVLRFHAARNILDRTGISVPKQVDIRKEVVSFEERLNSIRLKYESEDSVHDIEQDTESTPVVVMGTRELEKDDR